MSVSNGITIPYSIANGQTNDATQVMANYNILLLALNRALLDASAAITAWHQQVTAGGGTNKAFIACNGSGWYAFDY